MSIKMRSLVLLLYTRHWPLHLLYHKQKENVNKKVGYDSELNQSITDIDIIAHCFFFVNKSMILVLHIYKPNLVLHFKSYF